MRWTTQGGEKQPEHMFGRGGKVKPSKGGLLCTPLLCYTPHSHKHSGYSKHRQRKWRYGAVTLMDEKRDKKGNQTVGIGYTASSPFFPDDTISLSPRGPCPIEDRWWTLHTVVFPLHVTPGEMRSRESSECPLGDNTGTPEATNGLA